MKKINISSLLRPNISKLKPYSSARDEFQGEASIFLDANESPFPSLYNRYPDPHQKDLKVKIAQLKKITTEQVFLGNGSDEAIDLLVRAFCIPGKDNVIIPQPTYGMYSVSAETNDVKVKACSLTRDFDLDVAVILEAIDESSKLLFLCSPNNPTGNLLSKDGILRLAESFNGLVVVDEAYIDFAEDEGLVSCLQDFENLVILQTFSKAWGLAGIRLGLCLACPSIVSVLDKIKPPYNINSITQSIALDALSDLNPTKTRISEILTQKATLVNQLRNLGSIQKIFPSDANFLLVKVENARRVYQKLVEKGVIVRDRSNIQLCDDCLRITIGTREENDQLIKALKEI